MHQATTPDKLSSSEDAELMAELAAIPAGDVEILRPTSTLQIWENRIKAGFELIQSRALLPDSIRWSPYSMPIIIVVVGILVFLPLRVYFLLMAAGMAIGYCLAVPDPNEHGKSEAEESILAFLLAPLKCPERAERNAPVKLSVSPAIDTALDSLFDELVREIISVWYVPLCKSGNTEFQSCVRSTFNAAMMSLVKLSSSFTKDTLTLIIYGVTNALIVHMEEFRSLETSRLSLDRFLASGRSRRTHHRNYTEELDHLRQVAGLLLKKLLPKQESRSILLNSLLREIISGNALVGLVDRLADPVLINETIIKLLQNPKDALPRIDAGWNLVVIKGTSKRYQRVALSSAQGEELAFQRWIGGNLSCHPFCRKASQNTETGYKLSDATREHLKVYVQLCQFSYMGQDRTLGYAKLIPDFSQSSTSKAMRLKFQMKSNSSIDDLVNRTSLVPEILMEVTTVVGGTGRNNPAELNVNSDYSQAEGSPPGPGKESHGACYTPLVEESGPDHGIISLETALQNNELFMEFLEYLDSVKAPPYLQFLMNVDALRQFTAMSLNIDGKHAAAIEDCFRQEPLSETKIELLKMIKHDAADVYSTHFSDNARYRIPLDPGMQQEIQACVSRSDRLDEQRSYAGGLIGPNIYQTAYKWVVNMLEEVYFPKFKASSSFARFLDRARFTTLNFTIEEDRMSTTSHDSASIHRQHEANEAGKRNCDVSRTSSFENLNDIFGDFESLENTVPEVDLKNIVAEISITKQKLSILGEQLESLVKEDGNEVYAIRQLEEEKSNLKLHLSHLVEILESKQDLSEGYTEDIWVNLDNTTIEVVDFQYKSASSEANIMSSIWSSTVGPLVSAISDQAFDVIVRKTDEGSGNPILSVVKRSYAEFQDLHHELKKQFPKVGKIPLPEYSMLRGEPLDQSLANYLQMLISDEFIRESIFLRKFVSIDGSFSHANRGGSNIVEAIVGKKVKSALNLVFSGTSSVDSRREKFYETEERHTTHSLLSRDDEASSAAPKCMSTVCLPSEPLGSPLPQLTPERSRIPLERIPSVELPPIPKKASQPTATPLAPQICTIEEFSEAEIEMLIETFFAFVMETFDLREPNQWLRRKLLGVFKKLLKQAYGDTMNKVLTRNISEALTEDNVVYLIKQVRNLLYPEGVFIGRRPPLPIPSEDQKFALMIEARTLFLRKTPDFIQNMAGRYNAVCGMTRIFNSLQHKELNKTLIYSCLDITLKLLFSEAAGTV